MINTETNRALADPKIKAQLAALGNTVLPGSPADFGRANCQGNRQVGKGHQIRKRQTTVGGRHLVQTAEAVTMVFARRDFLHLTLGAVACASVLSAALALNYPTRPVTIIVPFAAGGPADITGRIVGEQLAKRLGQQFIIENVNGAGGTIGATRAARAKPDGYTLIIGHMGTHAAAPALYPDLAYHPAEDFAPIGLVAEFPEVLVTRKDFPARTLKDFVAYAKANQSKLNMAHAGVGSVSYVGCLLLNTAIGIKPTLVPFTGSAPATNALMAGQVDYFCDPIIGQLAQISVGN